MTASILLLNAHPPMLSTYHNHSTWSDGRASIREMALAAKAAGATEFGISDHFVPRPRPDFMDSVSWSMAPEQLDAYVEEALKIQAELDSPDFHVRLGMEVDYFPETVDDVNRRLAQLPLDYVIGAVHYAGDFPIDASAENWQRLSATEQADIWREYTRRITLCAKRLHCQWLAHPDLAKIYCIAPPHDCVDALAGLFDHCAKTGLCIEINTAGLDKPCHEAYPAPGLLKHAIDTGTGILVNADAHRPDQIVRHFEEVRPEVIRLGVNRFPTFEKRQCHWHDLKK